MLSRIKYKLSSECKLTLYNTLFLPHITYCCSIWGNTYKTRLYELVLLQNLRALRIVFNTSFKEHTNPLFYKAKCLKLEDLVKFNTNVFMFKAYYNLLPVNLKSLFTKIENIHKYSTRQKHNLYKKSVSSNIEARSTVNCGINLWNKLDDNIKLCKNMFLFKKKLKQY